MLVCLVVIAKEDKSVTFYFLSAPDFTVDSSHTTTMRLDQPVPDNMQLSFRMEWLYGGKIPAWAGSTEELVVVHKSVKAIHRDLRRALHVTG